MHRLKITIIYASIFLNSCTSPQAILSDSFEDLVSIVVPEPINAIDAKIIDDLAYIVLEEKENSFFGHVAKMRVYKDRIYILDAYFANSLFIYTIDGKHIATIGNNKGGGPLDFVKIVNFEIDYVNDLILTVDNFGRKFMIYDIEGKFVKRIDIRLPIFNAALLHDGHILHARAAWEYRRDFRNIHQVFITDESGQVIKEKFENAGNRNLKIHVTDIIRSHIDGSFTFAPEFKDTIFCVSFESIRPKYAIDYGKNRKLSNNTLRNLNDHTELFNQIYNGFMCFMGIHVENSDFLFFVLGESDNQIFVFFNKLTHKTISISHKTNRLAGGYVTRNYIPDLYTVLCSDSDGYFYGAFSNVGVEDLLELFPELIKLEQTRDLNPIIFRYKVKF